MSSLFKNLAQLCIGVGLDAFIARLIEKARDGRSCSGASYSWGGWFLEYVTEGIQF